MSNHDPATIPDHQLIAAAATGDRTAFERFVQRHAASVQRLARAFVNDGGEAEDIVQESFLAAYRAAGTFQPELGSARTWLFSIARNQARRTRRTARERAPHASLDEGSLLSLGVDAGWGAELPDVDFARKEQIERLAGAFAALREEDREILILRDLEGLAGEQVAELLGTSLAAMKSRLHRARLRLLAALREKGDSVVEHEQEIGGITCSAVLELLGDYVDGEAGLADVARIETHLRGCSVCERFGGRYGRVVHGVRHRLGAATIEDAQLERIRRLIAEL